MDGLAEMSQTALLAGGTLVAFVFLALLLALRRDPKDAPPRVSLGWPVIGNIAAFIKSPLNLIQHCYEK